MRQLFRRPSYSGVLLGVMWALWLSVSAGAAGETMMGTPQATMMADEMVMADCQSDIESSDCANQMAFCGLVCAGPTLALPTSDTRLAITSSTPIHLSVVRTFGSGWVAD